MAVDLLSVFLVSSPAHHAMLLYLDTRLIITSPGQNAAGKTKCPWNINTLLGRI